MVKAQKITLPLTIAAVRALSAGDVVLITGDIVTGRDRVHRFLAEEKPSSSEIPFDLSGTILYHCGPVVRKTAEGYRVLSAGPTTSIRVDIYEPAVIREYKPGGVMGKGGMGEKTREALKEFGCLYLSTVGGAAVYLADRIKKVQGVWKLDEFGPTEAMWGLFVEDFPAIVTMDSRGNDIHREIEEYSSKKFTELIRG